MIRYLVDTNVLSAAAPGRGSRTPELTEWMLVHTSRLYISVVTLAEIEQGIAKARRQGMRRQALVLGEWAELIVLLYANRILPIGVDIARLTGRFSDMARSKGHGPGFADTAIAATASANGLMVLTRNIPHFEPFEIPTWDPFSGLPPEQSAATSRH